MFRSSNVVILSGALIAIPLLPAPLVAQGQNDQRPEKRRSSLVQRRAIEPVRPINPPLAISTFPDEFRAIDGTNNNIGNPLWGAAGIELLRRTPVRYVDGIGEPVTLVPSARAVSNAVAAQDTDIPNTVGASDYLWQWGQFLDHDIDETPIADPAQPFDIAVPTGDMWFDPDDTGVATIGLDRSAYTFVNGVRTQLNNITAYIDASNVYGSGTDRAEVLWAMDGTGRLAQSNGDLLPYNTDGLANAPSAAIPTMFLAGDVRCNEQVGLTAMHTLFMREHNWWADRIGTEEPTLTGDEVYERARAMVAAEIQAITYNEFLPLLLGTGGFGGPQDVLPPYNGYRDNVNAGISNVFATAAYRVGHTMLSSTLLRIDETGNPIDAGNLALLDGFFSPAEIENHGIDSLLRGLAAQRAQQVDSFVIDDVRNFLFGEPGDGGFDLASLNIQRGRDHGIATYNQIRQTFGLPPARRFFDITGNPQVIRGLRSVYANPDQVDAWVGLLAERHAPTRMVGETLRRVLVDQFVRLRDGDRFWYQGYLPPETAQMIDEQTLAVIIRRNTDIGDQLPDDVFRVVETCRADFNADGLVDTFDLLAFLGAYWGDLPSGDINGDGQTNIGDVLAFVSIWLIGC